MIRFSAFLVVVAVGVLVAGVVTSKLLLVYIAIGVSGVALLALVIGAAVNWRELTGKPKTADTSAQGPAPVPPDSVPVPPVPVPVPPEPVPGPGYGSGRRFGCDRRSGCGRRSGRSHLRPVRPVPGRLPARRRAAER